MIGIHIFYDRNTQFWIEIRYNSYIAEKTGERTKSLATSFTQQLCNQDLRFYVSDNSLIFYNYANKSYESVFNKTDDQILHGFCGLNGIQTSSICERIFNIGNLINEPIRLEYEKHIIAFDNLKGLLGNFRR